MRLIITGGAGFIGSALVRLLRGRRDVSVLVLDKLTYAGNRLALEGASECGDIAFVRGDICDDDLVRRTLRDFQPDVILNLAAESHVDRSIDNAVDFIATNIEGVYKLLEAARCYWRALPCEARRRFRFVHLSTDEVFGVAPDGAAFTEHSPYDPRSPYSASKAAGDHLVCAWRHTHGLPTILAHASNNYGPYQFPEKLIPLMIMRAAAHDTLPIYGDGLQVRDWLHVEDHADGLWRLLQHGRGGERFVFGGRAQRANRDVVETVCDMLDEKLGRSGAPRRHLIRAVADRPGHDRRYAVDPSHAETRLGWRAKRTFEHGLSETIDWYLTHRTWWEQLRRNGAGERRGVAAAL